MDVQRQPERLTREAKTSSATTASTSTPESTTTMLSAANAKKRHRLTFVFNRLMAKLDSMLVSKGFMFLFMFMYVCAILLIFFWGAKEQWELSKDAPFRWYITIARGFGYTLNLNCALVILLACRLLFTSIRATWLNLLIPFDKIFPKFHIIVGYFVAGAVFFHAAFHIVWVAGWKQWSGGVYGITMTMTTGFILAAILLVMVITSMPRIRSKSFTWFYHFHTFGAALFFILLLVHGVYNGSLYTYKWIVAPIVIYCIDRVARNIKMATACLKLDDDSFTVRGDVVRIALNKPFDYRAGHYAELFIRSVHFMEWHPFTIASAPEEEKMVFYIKAVGDWTKKLRSEVLRRINGETTDPIKVLVRGPFGAPAQHTDGYDRIVLISGGIGATPFVSVCKHVYFQMKSRRMGATMLGYANDDEDAGEENKEENEEVSSEVAAAFKRLSESINTVIRGGGEVTDTDYWNYAQSASKLPLASPRACHPRECSKSDAVLTSVTTGNQVTGVTKISATDHQQRAAEAPVTTKTSGQATTQKTAATATATCTPSFMPERARSTPGVNKRISDVTWGTTVTASSTATTPTSQVASAPSPPAAIECEAKSDDTPAANALQKQPKSMDVIGRSFARLIDQQHGQGEDKAPSPTSTPTASTTPSTTTPTTPTSTNRDPMHSFAAKTMQIDDARAAQMVRNRAEVKIHVRTNRFFHSVSVSMLLCIMLILRLVLIALMDIFHVQNDRIMPGRGDAMAWMTAIDVSLGVFIVGGLCISLALDVVTSNQAFFTDCGRIIDLFVLVPVAIASNIMGVYVLVNGGEAVSKLVEQLHFAVLVGVTTLLMMYRLARIIGSRISLADRYTDSHFGKLTAMDFLWTTPTDDNDEWIRDELQPFANGTDLRLHRYVTRVDRDDPETGVQPVVSREMITNYGRPKWIELFTAIAERTPSNGRVGVFFCGPHGMADAVEQGMKAVQVKTILRGVYLGSGPDDLIQGELGLAGSGAVDVLRQKGSNIHFVFRKENF